MKRLVRLPPVRESKTCKESLSETRGAAQFYHLYFVKQRFRTPASPNIQEGQGGPKPGGIANSDDSAGIDLGDHSHGNGILRCNNIAKGSGQEYACRRADSCSLTEQFNSG